MKMLVSIDITKQNTGNRPKKIVRKKWTSTRKLTMYSKNEINGSIASSRAKERIPSSIPKTNKRGTEILYLIAVVGPLLSPYLF
jgi:hypothetical protein